MEKKDIVQTFGNTSNTIDFLIDQLQQRKAEGATHFDCDNISLYVIISEEEVLQMEINERVEKLRRLQGSY